MPTLNEWRLAEKLSISELARLLEKPQRTISRYCNGEQIPRTSEMVGIYVTTKGAVDPNSFYPLPDLKATRAANGEAAA